MMISFIMGAKKAAQNNLVLYEKVSSPLLNHTFILIINIIWKS